MSVQPDTVVSLHPYFRANEGELEAFKAMLPQFVEKTSNEERCLHYGFTLNGDVIFCRESYLGAEGVLAHLENVGELLGKALEISELFRIEVHGSAEELDKLREPMADLNPDLFVFECGIHN